MDNAIDFSKLFLELRNMGFKFGGPGHSGFAPLTVGGIITEFIPYLFVFAGLLLLLYLLYGGFQLLTSAGDPKAIEAGKSKVTNALIGFVIVFASYWLVKIVGSILGIGAITDIFK